MHVVRINYNVAVWYCCWSGTRPPWMERGGRGTIGMETRPEAGKFPIRRCPPRSQAKAAAGEKLT